MTFLKDYIKNLSLIKIAGIKYFAFIEVYSNQIKFSSLLIKNGISGSFINSSGSFEIIDSFSVAISDSERELENNFLKLFDKINRKDTYFILTTSHCRTKIFAVPKTSEDISFWVDENKKKILPEINNLEQFFFSHEILHDDEDNNYIALTYSRRDHISYYENLLAKHNVKILSFTSCGLVLNQFKSEEPAKLLIILLNEKILFSYYDNKKDFITDELFLQTNCNDSLLNAMVQIREILFSRRNLIQEQFEIILNCDNRVFDSACTIIAGIFPGVPVNNNFPLNKNEHISKIFFLNKLIKDFDNSSSLIEPERAKPVRDEIEKNAVMRIILMLSGIIMLFLILLNIFNYFVTNDLSANETFLLEKNSKTELMAKLDKDKSEFNKRLASLNNLKWDRGKHSYVLFLVSDAITANSLLTSVQINSGKNGAITIDIEGCAPDQESVSNILFNLEKKKELSGLVLLFSNKVNVSDNPSKYFTNNYIKFKMACNLNDNYK